MLSPHPDLPLHTAPRTYLYRDYETRGVLLLDKVGAHKYAADARTEVMCCAYAVDDGPVRLWKLGDAVPEKFFEAERNLSWTLVAHNDAFESSVEKLNLAPRFGWPVVPVERHVCTMAAALALALPAKLETLARVLHLEHQKDSAGHRLMLQMSKPRKARKGEDPEGGPYWFEDSDRLERLYEYCRAEIPCERELRGRLVPLLPFEQQLWLIDARINSRGFYIDRNLAQAARKIAMAAAPEINAELVELTDGAVVGVNQIARLLAWLREHGCVIKDLQADTVEEQLKSDALSAPARRALELRQDGCGSAVKKIDALLRCADDDDRVRGVFQFHKASTGRWAGARFQPQNLKRQEEGQSEIEAAIAAVSTGDYEHVRGLYPRALCVLGDLNRSLITAAPGKKLIGADFSAIESRILAYVADERWKLDAYRKFDATQDPRDEPYCVLACRMLGLPEGSITKDSPERKYGKTGDLACGYMGGANAIENFAPGVFSETEKERIKAAWRAAHPKTREFWYGIDRAAWQAVHERGRVVPCGPVAFKCAGAFLLLKLPSGRRLSYPQPQIKIKGDETFVSYMDNSEGRWRECRNGRGAYGGVWTENIVSAISRDILSEALVRCEAAGFALVLHVHDEIVAEVPADFNDLEQFTRLMTCVPSWAPTLPIAANAWSGPRFT